MGVTAIALAATLPIMGWWGIPEEHVSRARYREAHEAGFTHLMQYAGSVERMRNFLDMAQAEGLKLEVKMTQLHTDPENTVRALKDHPALAMYHIKDEPPVQDFAKWASLMKRIQAVDSVHPCYLNLLADSTDPMRWLGVPDYKTYLDRAVAELPLPFVSADYYPCILADKDMPRPYRDTDGKVVTKEKWYNQLEVLSATARREKLPLSLFACDVAHYNVTFVYPVPTLAMLRLQQYVNLAYGARSLQYFTYWNPDDKGLHKFHESIIRLDGTRGEVYDMVRTLNRELHARTPSFLGADVLDVSHTGADIPKGTKRIAALPDWITSLDTQDGGAVVSRMARGCEDILMVVNRSPLKEMALKIAFRERTRVKRVLDDGAFADVRAYGDVYRVAPGYAEIFIKKGVEK